MSAGKNIAPPKWADVFLSWYCRPELLEDLQGDLNEYFDRNVKSKGIRRAKFIYIIDVFKFMRLYTLRKPEFINLLINWIMIGSYIKISGRTIVRNKLFSGINIIGLAVSMSVGLLLIGMISDLLSYDSFHEKKDRIYRVMTTHKRNENFSMDLASTSVKAGQKIRETVSGVESVTLIRGQFSGDAIIDDKTVPITGIWADESFSKVFTFPFLQGNAATALKDPYSLVLTERTAKKLFGRTDVLGRSVKFDTTQYLITGVMKDVPKLSHLHFEALVSFSTAEILRPDSDGDFLSWGNFFSNYVYLVLPAGIDPATIQLSLDRINESENKADNHEQITISLQPLNEIVLGKNLTNQIGPAAAPLMLWIFGGLAFIVIVSACFNYTNLSIARSLRRTREIGIRKVIGAFRGHVMAQFIAEAVIISLLALAFSCLMFLFLRSQFLSIDPYFEALVSLQLTPKLIIWFIAFSVAIGVAAGFLPALFFSRINALQALRDLSSLRPFRHVSMRKTLIVMQYTFSLMFITATIIGYKQYKGFINFDLGFTTDNILNVKLQGNKAELLIKEFSSLPSVAAISKSRIITSVGSIYGAEFVYKDDSTGVGLNYVDDQYLPVHAHKLLFGRNFMPVNGEGDEIIVNEKLVRHFNIGNGDASKAIGETAKMDGKTFTIVGVMKDFNYGTLENEIRPTLFRYSKEPGGNINLKVSSADLPAFMNEVEAAWKKIDKIHPLEAAFYNDQIERAYRSYSAMLKIVGFLSLLAIIIASLGLLGMVVFTTETRLKEISVRKILGASEVVLIYLLGKGFLLLLLIAALIAIPVTYILFDQLLLTSVAYHQPIGIELLAGVTGVLLIACVMIGLQTLKAARTNPAQVLKNE